NQSRAEEEEHEVANLQIVESSIMEVETGDSAPVTELSLPEKSFQISKSQPLKPWRRTGTRMGRLLRSIETPIIIDQVSKGKRDRQVLEPTDHTEDSNTQNQVQAKKQKANSKMVGVASLEWHHPDK
ncbi:Unknown protein, partial [Striga hermonthica]